MKIALGRIELPLLPHQPGRNPRPPDDLFQPLFAELALLESIDELAQSAAYAAGFEAFFAGYFWEAHELWEPVWMALPPASRERHLLQGLIQLANAGLKRRMRQDGAAVKILARADAAIAEAFRESAITVMGVDSAYSANLRKQVIVL